MSDSLLLRKAQKSVANSVYRGSVNRTDRGQIEDSSTELSFNVVYSPQCKSNLDPSVHRRVKRIAITMTLNILMVKFTNEQTREKLK